MSTKETRVDELASIFGDLYKTDQVDTKRQSAPITELKRRREIRDYVNFINQATDADTLKQILLAYDITLENDYTVTTTNEITHSKRRVQRKDLYFIVDILSTYATAALKLNRETTPERMSQFKTICLHLMHEMFDLPSEASVDDSTIVKISKEMKTIKLDLEIESIEAAARFLTESPDMYSEEEMRRVNSTPEAQIIDDIFADYIQHRKESTANKIAKHKLSRQAKHESDQLREEATKPVALKSESNEWGDFFSDFYESR